MPNLLTMEQRAEKGVDVAIVAYEKRAQRILKEALDETRIMMSKIYERYAQNGVLTKAQMTQYNRLATLEKELMGILNPALKATIADMKRLPPDIYAESFFRHAWAVDQGLSVELKWGLLNKDDVSAMLANKFDKIAWGDYARGAQSKLLRALNDGLPIGKSYDVMARGIKDAFQKSLYNALRIIRTEGQYSQNAGADATYARAQELGIGGSEIWSATLDVKTRDTHAAMDGRNRDVDGYFTLPDGDRGLYPGDENLSAENRINCRCLLRFDVNNIPPEYRRTREDGIIEYMTYPEWIEGRKVWR